MKKVLIIDDEKNIQVSLASILEDEGYTTYHADSGEEGIEKFINVKPDAVFLDIWLPGIDGLETLSRLLEIDPATIIITMSGHGNISTVVKSVKAGAYDFLEKPLSLDKVLFVLKRGLEYRNVIEENIRLRTLLQEQEVDSNQENLRENTGMIRYNTTDIKDFRKQKTVKNSGIFYGIGIFSGEKTGMTIQPLEADKGIRFENMSEDGYVPARIEYLNTTTHATCIRKDNVEAKTIEHFMATLNAFGITNLSVKINREVPIGDGSASNFCEFIKESGIVEQEGIIPEVVVDREFLLGDPSGDNAFIKIEPADAFIVNYTTVYPEPMGVTTYEFRMDSAEAFEREIAPARTYGFVEDMKKMSDHQMAEGGRMNNFILLDKERGTVINTELRFPEELARHKILDIIGDFYLLGRPVKGKITARKTGHSDNARMVNLLKEAYVK